MIGTSPLKIGQIAQPRMRSLIGEALALRIEPNPERLMWHFYRQETVASPITAFWKIHAIAECNIVGGLRRG